MVTHNGYCDICNDHCDTHEVGSIYEVTALVGLADIQCRGCQWCPDPAILYLTRITHRTVEPEMFVERLGRVPEPGETVLCHSCMYPCEGFRRLGS